MPRPTNDEKLAQVHATALKQFDEIWSAISDERKQCLEDRRFATIPGAQWEGKEGDQFKNRPRYEVNKTHLAPMRIINEYRNNRITVDFISKDGKSDDELADACDGLFRADERDSGAEEAYDNAYEEGVLGGYGSFRLRTEYEDDEDPDDERQRIRIEPIYDADTSVFFDLNAKRQDKADAKHCFVLYSRTIQSFIDEFDDDPATWPKDDLGTGFDWSPPDVVFIAEYYLVDEQIDYALAYLGPAGDEKKMLESALTDEIADELQATGYQQTKRKRIKTRCVHKYLMSGASVLDDMGIIAGKNIPIVPFYGKRWFIDNVERCAGAVRYAKDAQRLKNMQLSKLAEISAVSSVSKPIVAPQQLSGQVNGRPISYYWQNDNMENFAVLPLNPLIGADGNPMPAGPLAYTQPPEIPPALAALIQLTDTDLSDILGNQRDTEKLVSNISGKAVEMIQQQKDIQSFIYESNFAKSIRRAGEIWLSMARDVYVEESRVMKTVGIQDEIGTVKLGEARMDPNTKALTTGVDFNRAKFDVVVDVGPSSTSRRQATVRELTSLLQMTQDPETVAVLLSTAMMNMEGEGLADIREYCRKKLVQMGIGKPTEEEAEAMASAAQQISANDKALEGMAEEAQAKAVKARVEVLETLANTKLTEAKTAETLSKIDISQTDQLASLAAQLGEATQAGAAEQVPAVQNL
jgi:hypothetical protein